MKDRIFKLLLSIQFILFINTYLYSQNFKSIHQTEWELHKNFPTHPSLIGDQNKAIIPLQHNEKKIDASVFGYLPYWATSDYLQYSLLSHIAVFGVTINETGTITNSHGWPWIALINEAHSHGVKIILTVILFNGDDIHTLITTQAYKNAFFQNIRNSILQGNADGVNIDFESLNNGDKGANIVNFMSDLTTYLHNEIPGSEVSFAGPAVNWGDYWNLVGLANACDYIFIMGYAFAGSWSSNSTAMAPLTGGSINIENTVNTQYGTVTQNNPHKLILGLPYYGYHWITSSGQARAPVTSNVGSAFYHSFQSGADTYGEIWDAQSQSPWYRYNDGNDWHQIWCDNDSSLGLKYDLAQSKNLKGVGMWALGYDNDRMELWYELYNQFGGTELLPPNIPDNFSVMIEDSTSLRINFSKSPFATQYYIYSSNNGINFPDSIKSSNNSELIQGLDTDSIHYFRVKAVNDSAESKPTEVLAAIPSNMQNEVLIVHGFDRNNTGNESKNYIRQHAKAFKNQNKSFSSCSNEAIIFDLVSMNDYKIVDWILGEESTADETFNFQEQSLVADFLDNGGYLFVSGSEIGWDLSHKGYAADKQFYANYLKSKYKADAPLGQSSVHYTVKQIAGTIFDGIASFNFDNGTHGTYNVDWPDAFTAMNGGNNCLLYSGVSQSNGVAAISFDGFFPNATIPGKLVHFGFPFETVYPESARDALMARIINFFETPLTSIDHEANISREFVLYQNYPNPFNSQTTINYNIPRNGDISIKIFDILGREIYGWSKSDIGPGFHQQIWYGKNNAGVSVNSGTYFLHIVFVDSEQSKQSNFIKLIYLE